MRKKTVTVTDAINNSKIASAKLDLPILPKIALKERLRVRMTSQWKETLISTVKIHSKD